MPSLGISSHPSASSARQNGKRPARMLLTSPRHSSISEPTLCRSGQSRSSDRAPKTYPSIMKAVGHSLRSQLSCQMPPKGPAIGAVKAPCPRMSACPSTIHRFITHRRKMVAALPPSPTLPSYKKRKIYRTSRSRLGGLISGLQQRPCGAERYR